MGIFRTYFIDHRLNKKKSGRLVDNENNPYSSLALFSFLLHYVYYNF